MKTKSMNHIFRQNIPDRGASRATKNLIPAIGELVQAAGHSKGVFGPVPFEILCRKNFTMCGTNLEIKETK